LIHCHAFFAALNRCSLTGLAAARRQSRATLENSPRAMRDENAWHGHELLAPTFRATT
jgi:hypothetical protein